VRGIVTAPAVGPPLGGWITDNFSWRWVFFINVPIGLISLLLSSRLIQDPPEFTEERRQAGEIIQTDHSQLSNCIAGIGSG
jgi:MFS transporter, DHA2 family, multidrug resistance protein